MFEDITVLKGVMLMYSGRLTAVDSLAARVISKLPFNPTNAGTRINISVMTLKTSQC